MGKLLENLKRYFENTPQDILDKDWEDLKYLNNIGPDVEEYYIMTRKQIEDHIRYLMDVMLVDRGGIEAWLDTYRRKYYTKYGHKPNGTELLNFMENDADVCTDMHVS